MYRVRVALRPDEGLPPSEHDAVKKEISLPQPCSKVSQSEQRLSYSVTKKFLITKRYLSPRFQ